MLQLRGSGKTAVLVERIINKILNENVDIDKLLVVTFTNAAASEMKQRVLDAIYKKLEEQPDNENLQKQILLLNKANICTIDSFCLDVVRNNFYELDNVSPNFKIADTSQIEILEQETLEQLFENKYEEEDKNFLELINTYTSYKDDTPLKELILNIFKNISSMPYPLKWLNNHVEMFNLKDCLDDDFANTPWGKVLLKDIEEELIDDINVLESAKNTASKVDELDSIVSIFEQDIDLLDTLKNNLDSWDKAYTIFQNHGFNKWPRVKSSNPIKEELKEIRDNIKKKFKSKIEKILLSDSKQSNIDIYEMYETLVKLKELIEEFITLFNQKKQEKNIVDFSDIEHFALNILLKADDEGNLCKTQVAKMYCEKFQEIAIDEYQDSNDVQEYIMNAIAKPNNLFMVGDVKQSIYKFRQAMPELFLNKYNTYKLLNEEEIKQDEQTDFLSVNSHLDNAKEKTIDSSTIKANNKNTKIQLYKNFRSRENILDFTNLVFQNLMSSKLGSIDYNKDEYLNFGAKDYKETKQDLKVEIDLIATDKTSILDSDKNCQPNPEPVAILPNESATDGNSDNNEEEKYEEIEIEAKYLAKKINELVKSKYQIYDRKKEQFRDIKYSDIAILLRSTKNKANVYEQELINKDIPVFSDSSQEYLDSIEIQTIIALLKIIDNPMQDIPLVTVMRSNIGKFTDDDLVKIRLSDKHDNYYTCLQKALINVDETLKQKLEVFLNNLKKWRKEQEYLALDELLWKIYSDTGFYNYCGLMPNGNIRQANLKFLFEKAKQFEQASFKGLYNFIKFIDKLKLGSNDMGSAKLIGENDDVVRIMSIHKSKGLEFPVVFLANINKQFNTQSIKTDQILIHNELGIGMKYKNYDTQVEYDTNAKKAVKNLLEIESLSEEMRVLYVAITRAKEKLFITGACKDFDKKLQNIKDQANIFKKEANKINYILVKKQKSYLDWLLLTKMYEDTEFNKLASINVISEKDAISDEKSTKLEDNIIKKLNEIKIDKDELQKVREQIEFEYKHKNSTITPTKTSVSMIKKQNDIFRDTSVLQEKLNDKKIIDNNKTILPEPSFIKNNEKTKLTGAQKGTLIHKCLQRLNPKVEYNEQSINEMINNMYLSHLINKTEMDSINQQKILNYTQSNIWKQVQKAKKVYKEKPFYIEIDANKVQSKNTEDKILVQGIIDLFYIDEQGKVVLVDYKTDYVENEKELIEKYKIQLDLYKQALEKALKQKVEKTYIYSIYLNKEIEIV